MNSSQRVTSMDRLIKLYKKHNNSPLESAHLVCGTCNTWLSKPIYLVDDGSHVCERCKQAKTNVCLRDISLEELLEDGEYPCKFSARGCKFFSSCIEQHEAECDYNICCFCEEAVGGMADLMDHLTTKHSMKMVEMTKPVAYIKLLKEDLQETDTVSYLLMAEHTLLLMLVQPNVPTNEISVSVYNASPANTPREMHFVIKLIHDDTNYSKSGKVSETFSKSHNKTTLRIHDWNKTGMLPFAFGIYFQGYEKFELYEEQFMEMLKDFECPVCWMTISNACYQCSNGHNVCTSCKKRISTCPICRLDINGNQVDIKNMASHCQKMCKNASNGCFTHGRISDMISHEVLCDANFRYITRNFGSNASAKPIVVKQFNSRINLRKKSIRLA